MIAALRAQDEARLAAALPEGDDEARFCYRWMLLDNLVHELNMLRGVLGEPDSGAPGQAEPDCVRHLAGFRRHQDVHMSWVELPGMAQYRQELAFYAVDKRITLTLPSPYLRNFPSLLTVEPGQEGSPFAARSVEITSFEEAFKRELAEFAAAIAGFTGTPRTDAISALHDIALCRSIALAHITGQPVGRPSALPGWAPAERAIRSNSAAEEGRA